MNDDDHEKDTASSTFISEVRESKNWPEWKFTRQTSTGPAEGTKNPTIKSGHENIVQTDAEIPSEKIDNEFNKENLYSDSILVKKTRKSGFILKN